MSPLQKMDKNKDGVVTLDEFIDCCQNVSYFPYPPTHTQLYTAIEK